MNESVNILAIVGPTAVGKTELALHLAEQIGAEIVSADSRQIYRELTIGSAKPSKDDLARVPHHFIDERSLPEPYDAGTFALEAEARLADILQRGKIPIVVGGSTLYVQGLVQGFATLPKSNPHIRKRLYEELHALGAGALYARLQALDPKQAQTLDPTKTQRLIRSLEIIELTGQKVSDLQQQHRLPRFRFTVVGLDLPRKVLYERINARVLTMMQNGLLKEAEMLYQKFGKQHREAKINALETVGYKELFEMFEGKHSLSDAIALIQQHTRNYAKRQLTFFRNKLTVHWMAAPEHERDLRFALQRVISIFPQPVFQ